MRALAYLGLLLGLALGVAITLAPVADASRNSGGTYSLPAGNPVTTGTTITSTWANTTLSDLGSEVTNSLDRNGKGGMLSALRGVDGTSSAPAYSWTSETSSGLFRNASNDIRMQVGSTNVQRWSTTTATFPLAVAVTGAQTNAAGVTVTQSTSNGDGVTTTGNGWGEGVVATGGGLGGYGGSMTGGADGGYGVVAIGTKTFPGVYGGGGATNGTGVAGVGTGTGYGGEFYAGTAASSGTRYAAIHAVNGDLAFGATVYPSSTTGATNLLNPGNLIKAWARIANGASPSVTSGFNIASVSCAASTLTVNIANDMADANYAVIANVAATTSAKQCFASPSAAGSFTVNCYTGGGADDMCAIGGNTMVLVLGTQ